MNKMGDVKVRQEIYSLEIVHNTAQQAAQVIRNKVLAGKPLNIAKKETFKELDLINNSIKKLSLNYLNSPHLNNSTSKWETLGYPLSFVPYLIFGLLFVCWIAYLFMKYVIKCIN